MSGEAGDFLSGLSPAARRAVIDRFLVEAPVRVREALAAAAAADDAGVVGAASALAAESGRLGLGELEAAAAALAHGARAPGGDSGAQLVALSLAWESTRAALVRARPPDA